MSDTNAVTEPLVPRTARERALCRQACLDGSMEYGERYASRVGIVAQKLAFARYPDPPRGTIQVLLLGDEVPANGGMPMAECSEVLRRQGLIYPRTCALHGVYSGGHTCGLYAEQWFEAAEDKTREVLASVLRPPTPRTIAQIALSPVGGDGTRVVAVSSDGVAYIGVSFTGAAVTAWQRCAPLPQDEVTP